MSGRPSEAPAGNAGLAAARIVALVARREFDARVRTESYLIGLLVTALLLVGILVVPALLSDEAPELGLVGAGAVAAELGRLPRRPRWS